jgi:outer membrane lipoprotein-sorting protein
MNSACEKMQDRLADYILGILSREEIIAVDEHVDGCPTCNQYMQALQNEDRILAQLGKDLEATMMARQDRAIEVLDRSTPTAHGKALPIWRTIMNSRMTTLATAAAVVIAVVVGMDYIGAPLDGANVTWGEVLENIRDARSLTWKTLCVVEGEAPKIMQAMVLEPHYRRFELPDGRIWISDYDQGRAVTLDSSSSTFSVESPIREGHRDIYDTFRNFQSARGYSAERIGERQIDNKPVIGFRLTKENQNFDEIKIWVDPETQLPVQIEAILESGLEQSIQFITTEIIFDSEIDLSLFSLEPPAGYVQGQVSSASVLVPQAKQLARRVAIAARAKQTELVGRLRSAVNLDLILKACRKYVEGHDGRWPDSLEGLTVYGLDQDVLTNPRQPATEKGYTYLKPPAAASESRIVVYEAFDVWEGGVNVGFANYQVKFIESESEFQELLELN